MRGFSRSAYYMGLEAVIQGDLDEAESQFERAFSWRPRWARVANTLGTVFMTAEDFERAAGFYDRALEVVPDYAEALLGKVRALTFLGRYLEAVAVTDTLLALERWYIGDARYWRAMNEVQLGQDDAAWDDVERAAKLITNAEVPKLAGIIAVRRQQLAVARAKFEEVACSETTRTVRCRSTWARSWWNSGSGQARWRRSSQPPRASIGAQEAIEGQIARIRATSTAGAPARRQLVRRGKSRGANNNSRRRRACAPLHGLTQRPRASISRATTEARQYVMHVTDDPQFGERARDLLARIPRGAGTP